MAANASHMICSRRRLISVSVQKKLEKSCTHSKEETVTPPAFAITSGITRMPFAFRISSAVGVVGPLAASTIILVRICGAFFFGNLFFKRGGNQKVRFKSPKLFAIERLHTFKARNAAMLRGMHQEFCGIESGGLVKRPCMILDRNHFCARFAEQPRRNASYIAESLYRNARARRNIDPFPARRFTPYDKDAAPGRFPAAQAAAKRNWLACDSAHHSVPLIH